MTLSVSVFQICSCAGLGSHFGGLDDHFLDNGTAQNGPSGNNVVYGLILAVAHLQVVIFLCGSDAFDTLLTPSVPNDECCCCSPGASTEKHCSALLLFGMIKSFRNVFVKVEGEQFRFLTFVAFEI